nr:alpha/beta hydrolase [Paenibacillus apis]
MHLVKKGSGAPTIVFEAGSGETSLSWRGIPDALSEDATVVVYDRAGYAWSEQAPSARSGENIVQELHEALQNAELPGPYIMVGHSLGGMYVRLFAQTYPDQVTGLVLVDARPENDERESKPILEKENFSGNPSVFTMKLLKSSGVMRIFKDGLLEGLIPKEDRDMFVNVIAKSTFFEAKDEEGRLAYITEDSIRGQHLGNLPVRIITRGIAPDYVSAGISEEGGRKLEEIWQTGQRQLLDISSDSEQVIAEASGHMIIHDQPELVVDTIRELLPSQP